MGSSHGRVEVKFTGVEGGPGQEVRLGCWSYLPPTHPIHSGGIDTVCWQGY